MIHKNNFQTNGGKSKQRATGLLAILCSVFMFVAVACAFGMSCFGTQTQQAQVLNANAAGDNYLTFTANTAGSTVKFVWTYCDVQTSTDGTNWSDYTEGTTITLTNIGDYVKFRSTNVESDFCHGFEMTGSISASGDVTSLTNGVGGDAELPGGCYLYLFAGCTSLTTAPNLPSMNVDGGCYERMFEGCTNLTTAPALPATTLCNSCYHEMFKGCTSLKTAPELPATTLVEYCYSGMFEGCTSLTTAPALPATTLAESCYYEMFKGCTGLVIKASKDSTCTEGWKIVATTDSDPSSGLGSMFSECTGVDFGSGSTEPALNTTYYQKGSEQPPVPSTGVYFDNTMAVVSSGIILASLVALFVLLAKRKKNN